MEVCSTHAQCLYLGFHLLILTFPLVLILIFLPAVVSNYFREVKSRFTGICVIGKHSFKMGDLTMLDEHAKYDRVQWACCKCGTMFKAHCGLDISPKHGDIVKLSKHEAIPDMPEYKRQELISVMKKQYPTKG